jgi:hypothetical protein
VKISKIAALNSPKSTHILQNITGHQSDVEKHSKGNLGPMELKLNSPYFASND